MGAAFQTHQPFKIESTIPSFGLSKNPSQLEPQSTHLSKYPPLNPLLEPSIGDLRFKNVLSDPSIPEITASLSTTVASSSAASGQNLPAYWTGTAYGYNPGRNSHPSNMADNMSPYGQLAPYATSTSPSTHTTAPSQQTQTVEQSQEPHQSQPSLVSQPQQSGHSLAATHPLMNGQPSSGPAASPTVPQTSLDPYGQRLRYVGGMHQSTIPQQQATFQSYHNSSLSMHPSTASGAPRMNVAPAQAPLGEGQQPLPQFSRPYPSYSLPAMNGPVMSNIHQPGNQMALVGNMQTNLLPGFNSGHAASIQQMYSGHPGSNPHHMHGTVSTSQPNDRPFRCNTCAQSFNRNHDLKRHTRIHLAVKPYPCGHCDKSFSRKDALKRHIIVKGCGKGRQPEADSLGSSQSTSSTTLSASKYSRDDEFGGDRGTPSSGQDSRKGSGAGL